MKLNENQLKEKHSERYQELERQLREKDAILDNYRKEHGKLEIFFNKVVDSISPISPMQIVYKGVKALNKHTTTPVMHISDAHCGAVQMPDEIEGFNSYNATICEERQTRYAIDFVKWVDMHRISYNINECAVVVTGDLISGDIHEELKVTNEFPAPVQVVKAAQILAKQIAIIAPKFTKVTVHFIAADNHARLTKKPQCKEEGINSMNYLVGMMASLYLNSHTNVEFNVYAMYEKVIHIEKISYLICHSHGIQSWMGIPWYSIERKIGKESQARLQIIMRDLERAKDVGFHKYLMGHFHTPFDSDMYACCGSVSGTDAYDHKCGRYAIPSQAGWLVNSNHGEFNRINFRLV